MTTQAQSIRQSFEQLPAVDKRDVAAEIMRRSPAFASPVLSDDALVAAAEEVFSGLERSEADAGEVG